MHGERAVHIPECAVQCPADSREGHIDRTPIFASTKQLGSDVQCASTVRPKPRPCERRAHRPSWSRVAASTCIAREAARCERSIPCDRKRRLSYAAASEHAPRAPESRESKIARDAASNRGKPCDGRSGEAGEHGPPRWCMWFLSHDAKLLVRVVVRPGDGLLSTTRPLYQAGPPPDF